MKKNSRIVWFGLLILVVVVAIGFGIQQFTASKTANAKLNGAAGTTSNTNSGNVTTSTNTTLEIKPTEVFILSPQNLSQTIALTGTIKAVQSAFVKVKVAGEISGLTLREGENVKVGQVLGKIDATEAVARFKQAQQQAASAKSQLDIAQRQLDNNQALMTQGFISKTALDNASSSFNGAKASYQAALEGVNLAQKSLSDTTLKAPISGVISQKLAQNGERLSIDSRVYEIVDLSKLELETSLPISDAQNIKIGQKAKLKIDSTTIENLDATVVRINPSVQNGSRSVLVYLSVAQHEALKHGLFAQGRIFMGESLSLVVPVSAIRTDKPSPYVQILEGNTVKHQKVSLGKRGEVNDQTVVEVIGLNANSQILSPSLGIVREGSTVRIVAPSVASSASAPTSTSSGQ